MSRLWMMISNIGSIEINQVIESMILELTHDTNNLIHQYNDDTWGDVNIDEVTNAIVYIDKLSTVSIFLEEPEYIICMLKLFCSDKFVDKMLVPMYPTVSKIIDVHMMILSATSSSETLNYIQSHDVIKMFSDRDINMNVRTDDNNLICVDLQS